MHIVDDMVTSVLHLIFEKMKAVNEDEIIARTRQSAAIDIKQRLAKAKAESAKALKEYESLKAEVVKAVQGLSSFPPDLLSELVNTARDKLISANEDVTALSLELEKEEERTANIRNDYHQLLEWSSMFDNSDMAVKKMIAGYIIKKVYVRSGYNMSFEFNMNIDQFNPGLDIPEPQRVSNL